MRRVVVTGIGVVAPNGVGKETFVENALAGRSFIEQDAEMEALGIKSRVLCRAREFRLDRHFSGDELTTLTSHDRFVQLGVTAGVLAIEDAALAAVDPTRVGLIFSSAIGGTPTIQKIWEECADGGPGEPKYRAVGPRFYDAGMFNVPAAILARRHRFEGPCTSLSTGCTAGLDALGLSFETIACGEADVMLAGASEAPLTTLTYATLDVIGSLSVADCAPEKASRPFDAKRAGFVIGEGAAVLVLESLEHAIARGARIYAEVVSYASDGNAFHMTDLPAHGEPMAKAIEGALRNGKVDPSTIDYVNAHGSSTPQNDVFETNAYKATLGARATTVPISSTKSMIGHSLSSASLMGVVAALTAIERGEIHPTINYEVEDPACDLDYVPNVARRADVKTALVTASGFGGIHSAAIFRKVEASDAA